MKHFKLPFFIYIDSYSSFIFSLMKKLFFPCQYFIISKRFLRILREYLFHKYLLLLLVRKTSQVEERLDILSYIHLNHRTGKNSHETLQDDMRISTWKAFTITTSSVQTCFYFYLHKLTDV